MEKPNNEEIGMDFDFVGSGQANDPSRDLDRGEGHSELFRWP